jgi:hypothetical protein
VSISLLHDHFAVLASIADGLQNIYLSFCYTLRLKPDIANQFLISHALGVLGRVHQWPNHHMAGPCSATSLLLWQEPKPPSLVMSTSGGRRSTLTLTKI